MADDLPDAPWAGGGDKSATALPDAPWADTSKSEPMSWSDVGSQALQNVGPSAGQFVSDIAQPFIHPIDTATNIKNLGEGVLQKTGVMSGTEHVGAADAVGKYFVDRYGSMDNFKHALAKDPVGVAGDLSALFTGGETALARAPGVLGRVGEVAGTVGRVLDPITTGIAAGAGRAAGALTKDVAVPSTRELYEAANNNYSNMRGYGVEIHRGPVHSVADNIITELETEGYRDYLTPKTFNAVGELHNPVGQHSTISDIEGVRRALNKAAGDPAERDAARRAIGQIDHFLANLDPGHVAINPHFAKDVAREAQEARGNYAAFKRSEQIDELQNKAQRQASRTGSGTNIDNATRQKISSILDNPKKVRGFSTEERQQMEQIVRGTFTGNAARLLGKLAPSGIVSGGLSAGIGALAAGQSGMVLLPAAGYAAKKASDFMTARGVRQLQRQVRARSPLAAQMGTGFAPSATPGLVRENLAAGLPIARQIGRISDQTNPYAGPNLGPLQP